MKYHHICVKTPSAQYQFYQWLESGDPESNVRTGFIARLGKYTLLRKGRGVDRIV
jgi:hypothetical protein